MIGIVGFGKLGSAFAKGFSNSGLEVLVYTLNKKKLENESVQIAESIQELTQRCQIIFLGLKPDVLINELKQNSEFLKEKILVSPAASLLLSEMESVFPDIKVIRIMPNIGASLNHTPIPYVLGKNISKEDENFFLEIFSRVGVTTKVEEKQMPIISAIAGSSPAYFAYFAQAMYDAAKEAGLNPETAKILLAQSLSGTGALLSHFSAQDIMEKVTTKGGLTEKGIKELDSAGVYLAIKHAVQFQSKDSS